jgi:hypothetical protein
MRRGFSGAGLSEARNIPGFGDGNRICREGCQEAEMEQERTTEEFDVGYYRKLLEKAWDEVSFMNKRDN